MPQSWHAGVLCTKDWAEKIIATVSIHTAAARGFKTAVPRPARAGAAPDPGAGGVRGASACEKAGRADRAPAAPTRTNTVRAAPGNRSAAATNASSNRGKRAEHYVPGPRRGDLP